MHGTPVIPVLRKLKQEDQTFQVNLSFKGDPVSSKIDGITHTIPSKGKTKHQELMGHLGNALIPCSLMLTTYSSFDSCLYSVHICFRNSQISPQD